MKFHLRMCSTEVLEKQRYKLEYASGAAHEPNQGINYGGNGVDFLPLQGRRRQIPGALQKLSGTQGIP